MGYEFNGFFVRDEMEAALRRYVEDGLIPGDFLQSVICNDLVEACGRADYVNIQNLPAFAAYLYNEMPATSWGSREKMLAYAAEQKAARGAGQPAPAGQ